MLLNDNSDINIKGTTWPDKKTGRIYKGGGGFSDCGTWLGTTCATFGHTQEVTTLVHKYMELW